MSFGGNFDDLLVWLLASGGAGFEIGDIWKSNLSSLVFWRGILNRWPTSGQAEWTSIDSTTAPGSQDGDGLLPRYRDTSMRIFEILPDLLWSNSISKILKWSNREFTALTWSLVRHQINSVGSINFQSYYIRRPFFLNLWQSFFLFVCLGLLVSSKHRSNIALLTFMY